MRHEITHTIEPITQQDYGGTHEITIRIPMEKGWIDNVKFHIWKENEQKEIEMEFDSDGTNETHACFKVKADLSSCQFDHYFFSYLAEWKLEHYLHVKAPEWAIGGVVYQIFPDRFCKGKGREKEPMDRRRNHDNWYEPPIIEPDEQGIPNNDFYGGDCIGVIEKLDYIRSLGADIIYFNPIFRSQSTHRYDTADYFHADPYFGTDEEVEKMAQVCHENGMKIILDAVFNHTGDDSIYFNRYHTFDSVGAAQGWESEYRQFYDWDENGNPKYWWNFTTLPVCDKSNPEFRNLIFGPKGVLHRWRHVADGWRFDVIDDLPEDFVEGCAHRMQLIKPNDYLIIGEVWENPEKKDRKQLRHGMHTVMNYLLMKGFVRYYKYSDTGALYKALEEINQYPLETRLTLMNSTSTHDTTRILEILGCDVFLNRENKDPWEIDFEGLWWKLSYSERIQRLRQNGGDYNQAIEKFKIEWLKNHKMTPEEYECGKQRMKSYVTALAFMPGMLTINYGDEVGMTGMGNLLNRGPYPWGYENQEILQFYRELVKSRKSEEFLRRADMRVLEISNEHFVFERYDDNNKAICVVSRVDYETQITIPKEYKNAQVVFCIEGSNQKTLTPYGAIVLKK